MIDTRQKLKECIAIESVFYDSIDTSIRGRIVSRIVKASHIELKQYLKYLRKSEYYYNNSYYITKKLINIINDGLHLFYRRRKNILGRKLGIEIEEGVFDCGLLIYHPSNIVVNPNAKIGKNCRLHGSNCIGNKGTENKAPVLGDNVELGVGASVIGDVYLADDIFVGANTLVNKTFEIRGARLVGIPAHVINR